MLFSILKRSFLNQKKAMAVMIVSVSVGTAIAASLLSLSLDIAAKVSKELRSFGANIIVQPRIAGLAGVSGQRRYLREEDIPKAKTIFWRHNIVGVMPVLAVRDDTLRTTVLGTWYQRVLAVPGEKKGFESGAAVVMPWWSIDGAWPRTENEVLAGVSFASQRGLTSGDRLTVLGRTVTVSGILTTGGREDDMLVTELSSVQRLAGLAGRVSQVYVLSLIHI